MTPFTPKSQKARFVRPALHIVNTTPLAGNEILVEFSDGSGAVYAADELEKLRPRPTQWLADPRMADGPIYAKAV